MCDKIYLTKAKSMKLSIKILHKSSKIRVFVYRLDIYNLRTKTVSFPDQEKLLKEVVVVPAVSMKVNTKNSQIKHCSYPKYAVI